MRNKEEIEKICARLNKVFIDRPIKKALKKSDLDDDGYIVSYESEEDEEEHKEYIEQRKFQIRSGIIKNFHAALVKMTKEVEDKYNKELNWSKANRFPYKWMTEDKRIAEVIRNQPIIINLLNYLLNLNRYIKNNEFDEMNERNSEVTGGTKHAGKHEYSSFVADKEFYKEASKALGISESYVKKLISAFDKTGIIKKLGTVRTGTRGKPPSLFADGFFTEGGGGNMKKGTKVKHMFLKRDKTYIDALGKLPKYIN